MKTMKKKQQI